MLVARNAETIKLQVNCWLGIDLPLSTNIPLTRTGIALIFFSMPVMSGGILLISMAISLISTSTPLISTRTPLTN